MPVAALLAGALVLAVTVTALALWTNPPGLLLRAHQADVRALHWARRHLLNAGAVGVFAALAGIFATVAMPLLIRRWDRRRIDEPDSLLNSVHSMWIVDVLRTKLKDSSTPPPRWRTAPDMVNPGMWPDGPFQWNSELIPDGRAIAQVFDDTGRSLLIAGAAGSGKTVLLLCLAEQLLAEAKTREHTPVVIDLSSWSDQQEDFSSWLSGRLAATYKIPKRFTATWVRDNRLALLLDGLDEVDEKYRAACIEAINAYRSDHGTVPMAVCGRTGALEHLNVKLDLRRAIEARPLMDSEIDQYLSARLHEPQLSAVRAIVASDPGFQTPLMLPLIAAACKRPLPPSLVQRQVWAAYIQQMFMERPLKGSRYTEQEALRWLTALARELHYSPCTQFRVDTLMKDIVPAVPRKARHISPRSLVTKGAIVIFSLWVWFEYHGISWVGPLMLCPIFWVMLSVVDSIDISYTPIALLLYYWEHFRRARRGDVPWRYRSFLNAMAERQLLLRPGRNYMFWHDSLREYLAWSV